MRQRSDTRIGWNLLPLRREALGGWLYTQGLLEAAATHGSGLRLAAFVTPESRPLVEHLKSVEVVEVGVRSDLRALRVLAEHTRLPGLARHHALQCMHSFGVTAPPLRGVATALSIYDLSVFVRPEGYSPLKRWYLQRAIPASIARAATVLPMSEATAIDVRRFFPDAATHLAVIPHVVGEEWHPPTVEECESFRKEFSLPAKYWLCVSTGYKYKNHEGLLQALAMMRADGVEPWPLVLRGLYLEPHLRRAAELGVGDLVQVVPQLDQSQMRALYGASAGCVQPSFFEGGGLPGMEAMACAAPLVASDIPTSREFLSGYADLFDPADPHQIANAMLRVQRIPPARDELRRIAHRQLQRQRPGSVATQLFSAYDVAIGRRTEVDTTVSRIVSR